MSMEGVDIGILRPVTLHISITEFIIAVIEVVTVVEADIGPKRSANIPLAIVDQLLMLMGELNICISPETLPTTTQMDVVYFGSIIFFPSCLRRF